MGSGRLVYSKFEQKWMSSQFPKTTTTFILNVENCKKVT